MENESTETLSNCAAELALSLEKGSLAWTKGNGESLALFVLLDS